VWRCSWLRSPGSAGASGRPPPGRHPCAPSGRAGCDSLAGLRNVFHDLALERPRAVRTIDVRIAPGGRARPVARGHLPCKRPRVDVATRWRSGDRRAAGNDAAGMSSGMNQTFPTSPVQQSGYRSGVRGRTTGAISTSPALPMVPVPSLNAKRRQLLLVMGAGGAGAVAAAAVPAIAAAPPAPPAASKRSSSGYRVSEHVRNYYQTARR
jgi:hypothetical protein